MTIKINATLDRIHQPGLDHFDGVAQIGFDVLWLDNEKHTCYTFGEDAEVIANKTIGAHIEAEIVNRSQAEFLTQTKHLKLRLRNVR